MQIREEALNISNIQSRQQPSKPKHLLCSHVSSSFRRFRRLVVISVVVVSVVVVSIIVVSVVVVSVVVVSVIVVSESSSSLRRHRFVVVVASSSSLRVFVSSCLGVFVASSLRRFVVAAASLLCFVASLGVVSPHLPGEILRVVLVSFSHFQLIFPSFSLNLSQF